MESGVASGDVLLAVIGDVHAHARRLARVLDRVAERGPDAILLVGDIGSNELGRMRRATPGRILSWRRSAERVIAACRALGVPVLWVPGNHDLRDLDGEGQVDRRAGVAAGLVVWGIGGAGPERFGFPYEWDEDEVRALEAPECDVLLCHAPPARTPLDVLARGGEHVGSEALRERAERHDGVYACGHIHEAPGAVQLGRCLCLNAGGLGEPYGRAQVGFLRRDPALPGLWEAEHEDLESGTLRRWRRGSDGEPDGGIGEVLDSSGEPA
jgi:Icc-related predicted phosphoesterase